LVSISEEPLKNKLHRVVVWVKLAAFDRVLVAVVVAAVGMWATLLQRCPHAHSRRVRGIIRASAEVALHIITDVDSFGVYERDALSWV